MLNIQLYIEGEQVDLFNDESVTLNQSIQDIRDLDKVFTEFTRTFNVPASKSNNKLFKHFYNYHIDGYDARIKQPAELHINYKPFKKGRVRLEGTSLRNNEAYTYKLTFYGNTVTISDLIGEDQLGSLAHLTAYDFQYNDTNLVAYMTDGLDDNIGDLYLEEAVILPLITHTARLTYSTSTNGANNIYTGHANNGVGIGQFKPAIKILAIIKAIELKYSITFSSDFFSKDNDALSNLYMWLHTKAGGMFEDLNPIHLATGYQRTGDNVTGVFSNNVGITIGAARNADYSIKIKVVPADGAVEYGVVLQNEGKEVSKLTGLTGTTTNGSAEGENVSEIDITFGAHQIFIETTGATTFDIEATVTQKSTAVLVFTSRERAVYTASVTTFSDTPVTITQHLPEIKVLDFLTGLFKMFNLTAFINENGVIVVQTLDEFYASSSKVWDITSYVDTTKSQIDTTIPFRQIDLGYEGVETFLANAYKTQNNKDWGKLEYNSEFDYEGETYSIKLPFEHLLYERLSNTNIQWGWYADEQQEAISGKPLLFYAIKPVGGDIAVNNIAGTQITVTKPYMPSNSAAVFSNFYIPNFKQSLNFHAEIDEYAGVTNTKTLFKTYYENYIKDLFDKRKRLTKLSAFLPLTILQKLSLADHFKIFGNEYRINNITTDFQTNITNLILTNVLDNAVIDAPLRIDEVVIDTGGDDITADSDVVTADNFTDTADDFAGDPETEEVGGGDIVGNDPEPVGIEPCEATPATIERGTHIGGIDSITFNYNILGAGTSCDQFNIDEYGFLVSDTKSDLTGTDIETIKGTSGVDVFAFERSEGSPSLVEGEKTVKITGLTDPATRHGRFYVKTDSSNTDGDILSDVFSHETDIGVVLVDSDKITVDDTDSVKTDSGENDSTGLDAEVTANNSISETRFDASLVGLFDTLPTEAEVKVGPTTGLNYGCEINVSLGYFDHNGTGVQPTVGDRMKRHFGNVTYSTVTSAFGATYTTKPYAVFALPDVDTVTLTGTRLKGNVQRHVVIDTATNFIVKEYSCVLEVEPVVEGTTFRLIGAQNVLPTQSFLATHYQLNQYLGRITIPDNLMTWNTDTEFPVVGSKVKLERYLGTDISTSFDSTGTGVWGGQYTTALYINGQIVIDRINRCSFIASSWTGEVIMSTHKE